MNRRSTILGIVLVSVMATAGIGWIWHDGGYESTDDAQIESDVATLSTESGGRVASVHVHENEHVRKGDVILELDDALLRAKLAAAEAEVDEALADERRLMVEERLVETTTPGTDLTLRAGVDDAQSSVAAAAADRAAAEAKVVDTSGDAALAATRRLRSSVLVASGALSPVALEDANRDLLEAEMAHRAAESSRDAMTARERVAKARVAAARGRVLEGGSAELRIASARARHDAGRARLKAASAAVESVRTEAAHTQIVAPEDGTITNLSAFVGASVATGQPVAALVPHTRFVTANFKETQLAHLREGMPVRIKVDAIPGGALEGRIESLAPVTGARVAALRPDNASGNFVKVVQRVPVRIALDSDVSTLRAGLSAEVQVRTR